MKAKFSPRSLSIVLAIACVLALCGQAAVAQSCPAGVTGSTCTRVFSAVNLRTSEATAGYSGAVDVNNNPLAPDIFNTSTMSVTCSASPIIATLSGPQMNPGGTAPALDINNNLQAGGQLLVDNTLFVSVNGSIPTNVCTGYYQGTSFAPPIGPTQTVPPGEANNCFEAPYSSAIGYPNIPTPPLGYNPDTTPGIGSSQTIDFVGGLPVTTFPSGGVGSIDISSLLSVSNTPQSLTIQLQDNGGVLTSSTVFLATNCTVNGVTGPATVSGNPITSSGPNPQGLTQTFNFNSTPNNTVGFVYDIAPASGTITNNGNGAIPQTADLPVDPTIFQPNYVAGTSFATSNCLVHSGELLPNGNPACKLYTLLCTTGTGATATGAQCPVSSVANEVVKDVFDGPQFSLQNIYAGDDVFHEGIGLLMASDTWPSSPVAPCTFDVYSGLQSLPCPQNLLTSFTGPGGFGGFGQTTNPNSTFISIYGVPQDKTSVFVAGQWPDHWVSSSTPSVYFATEAPNFTKGAKVQSGNTLVPLPGAAKFIPAPIQSITYGISPANSVPSALTVPVPGDNVLTSSANCAAIPFTSPSVPNFAPAVQKLSYLPDGQYALHYYAEDCAGTRELLFATVPSNQGPSWTTNFYTVPIKIDTLAPTITGLAITTAAPYKVGSTVYASYTCTDPTALVNGLNTGSGLVLCGSNTFAPETTYSATLQTKLNTSSTGTKSFTVYAIDGAANVTSKTITYTVTK